MALRSGIVSRHEIPGEPGEWMDLRQLGWRDLDQARRARQDDSFDSLRKMGADLYDMIASRARNDGDTATVDALASYDLGTVLALGVAAWSYDEPVTPENVGSLDPATAEWAARIIIGDDETEAARKNG